MSIDLGRLTKAAIHCEAGELEVKLSAQGNWQLSIRGKDDRDWRLACSGDLDGGALAPPAPPRREPVQPPVRLGSLFVDTEGRRALVDEVEVHLLSREFELLAMLASEPNRVFTVEQIQREAFEYGNFVPATRTVATHACRLRGKLREAGGEGLVVNCHGVGYKLWHGVELADVSAGAAA